MSRLASAVAKLQGQHHPFERSKRGEREQADEGEPDNYLKPDGRTKLYLGAEQPAAAYRPDNEEDEHHRTIARIRHRQIEAADFADRPHLDETLK